MFQLNFRQMTLLVAASLVFLASGTAHATTFTFTGDTTTQAGKNWFNQFNWTPNGIPGAGDDAIINQSTPGAITVQFGGTITVASLTLSNANSNLDGRPTAQNPNGILNVTSAFNWSGGTFQGAVINVSTGAQLNISGSAPKVIGGILNNAGTATWTGTGNIELFEEAAGSELNNSGTFTIQTNAALDNTRAQFGAARVTNTGTITKNTITGINQFGHLRFISDGTLNINTGSIELHGLVTLGGPVNVAASSFLNLATGTYRFNEGTSFNGAGRVRVFDSKNLANGGTAAIDASGIVNLTGTFDFIGTSENDGALNIRTTGDSLTLNGNGTFNWTGGKFVLGTFNVGSNITWNISGAATKGIQSTNFNNAGLVNWTGAGNIYPLTSTFNNTGTFNVQTDADIDGFNGEMTFNNSGTFTKSASSGVTQIGGGSALGFNNSGAVNVNSGTLEFKLAKGGVQSGPFNVALGTLLRMLGPPNMQEIVFTPGTIFTGAGKVQISDDVNRILLRGAALVECLFELDGALNNQGSSTALTLSGTGPVMWNRGEINGVLRINPGTPFHISGTDTNRVLLGTLNNAGTAVWSGTGLITLLGTLNNSGTFTVQNNEALSVAGFGVNGTFNNTGAFIKTSTGTTTIGSSGFAANLTFNNSGTIGIENGTLLVHGTLTQTAGATTLHSSKLQMDDALLLQGGTLRGMGTITGNINNSGGTVSPGLSPGTLAENGNFIQGANGTLDIEINGVPPTTQDHLDVSGTVQLGGTLRVTLGFAPAAGTTFNIINNDDTDAVIGTFAGLPQGALVSTNNVLLQIAYDGGDGNDVTLTRLVSPTLSINDVTIAEGNTGTKNATFTMTLSFAIPQTVSVNAIPFNGSARASFDYVSGGQNLVFNPGQTSKTFSVPVIGDTLDEDPETFFVVLSSPVNASILRGRGTGTINDNDAAPSITIEDVNIGEGNGGQRTAVFRLHLSAPSGRLVKVNYATAAGSTNPATAGTDYVAVTPTQIAFTTGQTITLARVLINGDTLNENDETFKVNLSSAINATIGDAQAIGTILNDDSAPAISIDDVSVTEGSSGTKNLTFTLTLTRPSAKSISVNYTTANGSARSDSDYGATNGTLVFAANQTSRTLNVVINGDTVVEGNETFFVLLSAPTNASIGRARGVGTITNDDTSN